MVSLVVFFVSILTLIVSPVIAAENPDRGIITSHPADETSILKLIEYAMEVACEQDNSSLYSSPYYKYDTKTGECLIHINPND